MSMALNATGRPILYSMCNCKLVSLSYAHVLMSLRGGEDGPWNFAVVSVSGLSPLSLTTRLSSDHGEQLAHLRGHYGCNGAFMCEDQS
jgi:hypothetical protein